MSSGDNWCRHRTPFTNDHKVCKAGVDFHLFEDGAYKQRPSLMPCLGECAEGIARCEKYSGYTPEEIAERERRFTERFTRIGVIRKAIIDSKQRQGQIQCPACKTGTVGFSVANNGHVHGKCSTEGCASWME